MTTVLADIWMDYSCPGGIWSRHWFPGNPVPVCEGPGTVPPPQPSLQITASAPVIPSDGAAQNGKVLTKSNLTLRVTQSGQPISGIFIGLKSNRGSLDAVQNPTAATNASGTSTASVSTRAQPGQSSIGVTSPLNLQAATPANINWLPARYENSFLVTCYTLAVEAEASATPVSHNVCGLPSANHYRSKFLTDVKMQGSGQALDGSIVHYSGQGCFNIDSCARTATGACATVGTTIAVDRSIIPRGSTVTVDILGQRKAQDGGGWINGYHIDDYMGPQRAACLQLGHRNSGITFQSY
ncbi:3D domain-containing protein [Ralstonia syzygii]|uniref:3D domain-containing protein n=1 Tax=Ralstonia syzygii TaxID=28097 RepID=UPI001E2FE708|nr:3D domain-containing protein [Ralstonia syzygii]